MTTEQATAKRRWRPRFSLLTLVLGVLFVGACGGLWWRWEPWVCEATLVMGSTSIDRVDISPNDRLVLIVSGSDVDIWDIRSKQRTMGMTTSVGRIQFAEFMDHGRQLVVAGEERIAAAYDPETGKKLGWQWSSSDDKPPYATLLDLHGDHVFECYQDTGAWRIYDTASKRAGPRIYAHDGYIRHADISPDGRYVVTASNDHMAGVWDTETGQLRFVLQGHSAAVLSATYSPDGQKIATTSSDGTIRIWDSDTGRECVILTGHGPHVYNAAFTQDGQRLVSSCRDNTARVWDIRRGRELAMLGGRGNFVSWVDMTQDGSHIVAANFDGTFQIWTRRRPEYWWGIAWLPEFWVALLSGGALLVIAARRLRACKAVKQEAA